MHRTFLLCCWAIVATGCTVVTTAQGERLGMRSAAFRSYAETVFRQQNQALDELALQLDAGLDTDELVELEAAEVELLAACARLNELAARRRDQRRLGLGRQWRAARTTPDCERALLAAQALLDARAR